MNAKGKLLIFSNFLFNAKPKEWRRGRLAVATSLGHENKNSRPAGQMRGKELSRIFKQRGEVCNEVAQAFSRRLEIASLLGETTTFVILGFA